VFIIYVDVYSMHLKVPKINIVLLDHNNISFKYIHIYIYLIIYINV